MISMRYQAVLFDVDGTLTDSESLLVNSLIGTMEELDIPEPDVDLHALAMRNPKRVVLEKLGAANVSEALEIWNCRLQAMMPDSRLFPGAADAVHALHEMGCSLGVVTARTGAETDSDPAMAPLHPLFTVRACAEDTQEHKPHPAPLLHCLQKLNLEPKDALYVGDSPTDAAAAHAAGMDFALALWGCAPGEHIHSEYYLARPDDLLVIVRGCDNCWLAWAQELQFPHKPD